MAVALLIIVSGCDTAKKDEYDSALLLLNNGFYVEAIAAFDKLGGYKDSAEKKLEAQDMVFGGDYAQATIYFMNGTYEQAYESFASFGEYRDSAKKAEECLSHIYETATSQYKAANYEKALETYLWLADRKYKDSPEMADTCKTVIKERAYEAAEVLMDEKKYEEAVIAFSALNGYKDSEEKISTAKTILFNAAEKNSVVFFGSYEQDNNDETGKEEIEWIVLDKKGKKLLLVSKYALDARKFHYSSETYLEWENSDLRSWLNSIFLLRAFTPEERSKIIQTTNKNPDNKKSLNWKETLSDTADLVFLLSVNEVNHYFSKDSDRICFATAYANTQCEKPYDKGCYWWLRSTSHYESYYCEEYTAGIVYIEGDVSTSRGFFSDDDRPCIRPVLWVEIG